MKPFAQITAVAALACLLAPPVAAAEKVESRTQTNVPVEIQFDAARRYADPFHDVKLDLVATEPNGTERRVPAFWAGGSTWKARYASPNFGLHRWRSESNQADDAGLTGRSGTIQIRTYEGTNELLLHGPIRVAADHRHFEHADGTPLFWLGDTWWMGLCQRLRWPEDFQRLAADRKAKGFNVVQIVAGLYPDMHPFDERGANEAGFPWEKDYTRIRPEYFDRADERLWHLVDQGITPCLVGAWGYFMPWMGVEKLDAHWRYLIARYGSWPVVWCAAGEANLNWYQAAGFPRDDREQVHGWTDVLRSIRQTDPWRRPLTIHPTAINKYTSRHATDDPALLDFDMLQTPHGQGEAVSITIQAMRESYAAQPTMPVINGEAAYEKLGDSLPTEWTRTMFWLCMTGGAAGHTYGANGIWQVNRKGQPHGNSPTGGNYGQIAWDEAMNLPGSTQMAIGKKFFESLPWTELVPMPESVRWSGSQGELANWIWYPEGEPKRNAPLETRYFRRVFDLDGFLQPEQAELAITADDKYTVWLNGELVGQGGRLAEAADVRRTQTAPRAWQRAGRRRDQSQNAGRVESGRVQCPIDAGRPDDRHRRELALFAARSRRLARRQFRRLQVARRSRAGQVRRRPLGAIDRRRCQVSAAGLWNRRPAASDLRHRARCDRAGRPAPRGQLPPHDYGPGER